MADQAGCCSVTIANWMKGYNIERRSGGATDWRAARNLVYRDERWLRTRYCEEGRTLEQMAHEAGCGGATIWSWMKKFSIERRRSCSSQDSNPSKECVICGHPLPAYKRKYCDEVCARAGHRERRKPYNRRVLAEMREATRKRRAQREQERTKICRACGKPFVWKWGPDQVYCTRECKWNGDHENPGRFKKTLPDSERKRRERERSKHRHRKLRNGGIDREAIFERDGWICQLCGKPVNPGIRFPDPMSPSLDHIHPLALGGQHIPDNLQLAHYGCNSRKSATRRWRQKQQYARRGMRL